jgi:hypothetical protein
MLANRSFRWFIPFVTVVFVALASTAAGAPTSGRQVTVQGRLEVLHQDTFGPEGSIHHYTLVSGKERLGLSFPDAGPYELAQAVVRVTGVRSGNGVSVASSTSPHVELVRTAPAPGGGKGGGPGGSGGDSVTPVSGDRDTLVIMFNFADKPTYYDYTPEEMRGSMFTDTDSVATYYNEVSFGTVTYSGKNDGTLADHDGLPGDVAGWYTINQDSTTCNETSWASAAQSAAEAEGWDLAGYEHIIHYFPLVTSCSFRGRGQLGGSSTWVNGSAPVWEQPLEFIIAHELGHNLTLHHAEGYSCSQGGVQVSFSGTCTTLAYEDRFDTMGRAYRQLNTFNKSHLGWISGTDIVTAAGGGTYTLDPLEIPSGGANPQVLRVDRGKEKGKTTYLYVEFRRPIGFDAPVTDTGAQIRLAPHFTSNAVTWLLDTDPSTATFGDATLLAGHGFIDPVKNIWIRTISSDGSTLTVSVERNRSNSAPQTQAGTAHPLVIGLPHAHEGGTATDADWNLGRYEWAWVSCPSTCPAMTGVSGSLASAPSGSSADVPGPTFTPAEAGTYALSLTVWDTAGAKITTTLDEIATTAPSPAPEPGV